MRTFLTNLTICNMTIKLVSVSDARTNFSELIGRTQYGNEATIITHHDKPVAVLVPYEESSESEGKQIAGIINYIKERYGSPFLSPSVEAVRKIMAAEDELVKPEAEPPVPQFEGTVVHSLRRELKEIVGQMIQLTRDPAAARPKFDAYLKEVHGYEGAEADEWWGLALDDLGLSPE